MSLTKTKQLELGFKAPDFKLPDVVSGKEMSYADISGERATLVMFICNHCPYVIHVRQQLIDLANDYKNRGVGFVAISANDAENYPDDSPEKMKKLAEELSFPFPYLYDESQETAKAYGAECTPDFALFNHADECVYRGRLDDARPGNDRPVTGSDLREAIDTVLKGDAIDWQQEPSMGCNIKWKPENQ